jgi:cytochrome c556
MNIKSLSLALTLCFTLPGASWAAPPSDASRSQRITELKREILRISEQASRKVTYDNEDNDPAVRARLTPLIQELLALAPARTQQETLTDVVGVWKSVWSDLSYFGPFAPRADSMYQVVFPTGYYYNLSTYDGAAGTFTSVIKGTFFVAEPTLQIEFVKATRFPEALPRGADLATVAMRAELGVYDFELDPNNAPGIGFRSTFRQEYVDEDLRIGTGPVMNGFNTLFILRRADKVE